MIFDDAEKFLKFLNNAGRELSSLLDLDHNQVDSDGRRSQDQAQSNQKPKARSLRTRTRISNGSSGRSRASMRRLPLSRVRGKTRSTRNDAPDEQSNSHHMLNVANQQQQQQQQQQPTSNGQHHLIDQADLNQELGKILQHTSSLNSSANANQQPTSTDAHQLEGCGQVLSSLSITVDDELHGTSISPVPHLSPIDSSSIAFHQPHYYTPGRNHLELYQLHDDFASDTHDPIPTNNSSSQQQQQHHLNAQLHHHQQQMSHRPQNADATTTLTAVNSTDDCGSYQQQILHQPLSHNQHHQSQHQLDQQHQQHHHHQHHQTQHNQQHQQQQHYQLDQSWMSASSGVDANLHIVNSVDPLDHVVSLSPAAQQSLDHAHFSSPIYHHHGTYYNHHHQQTEPLDSFQQLTSDEFPHGSTTRQTSRQQHHHQSHHQPQPQQQQQQPHRQQHQQGNSVAGSNNDYDLQHHLQQQQQHHHHHHHHHEQTSYSLLNIQSHHPHHSSTQHQMMPLLNGLESSGVILQDINLASASWSSPEDLYSI